MDGNLSQMNDTGDESSSSTTSDSALERPRSGRKVSTSSRQSPRKSGDERWKELLEVSARMFAARGYAATSLQHIADELGMLKGSLYYYINTKDDLLYEVIRGVYWEGVANFRRISTGPGDSIERLQRAVEGHVRYLVDNITATTVFLHEFDRLSDGRREELSALGYYEQWRDLIRAGQAEGAIRAEVDASMAAMAILGATNWIYRWYRDPGSRGPEEIGRQFADMFVAGLITPERAAAH